MIGETPMDATRPPDITEWDQVLEIQPEDSKEALLAKEQVDKNLADIYKQKDTGVLSKKTLWSENIGASLIDMSGLAIMKPIEEILPDQPTVIEDHLLDFKNPEVNNYYRLKKLEEQEQNLDDQNDENQDELDQDSDDSQTAKAKDEMEKLKALVEEGVSKKMQLETSNLDISKGQISSRTKRQGTLKKGKSIIPPKPEEIRKKKENDEKIKKDQRMADFQDSQIQYKNYMDQRERFNTNEEKQEALRKQYEPFSSEDEEEDKSQNIFDGLILNPFKSNEANDDEDDDGGEENEKQKDGEEDQEDNVEDLPSLDFKKLLANDKRQKTLELPFTNTQVEDVIFLRPRSETIKNPDKSDKNKNTKTVLIQEIISLQCNFYQTDCYYNSMQENKKPVNRMGTENYEVSDWDMTLKKSSFDKVHKNLVIDKKQSYTGKNNSQLMATENKEGLVEYFLAKWRVNENGGMKMIMQSEYFKMDGTFKEHDRDVMELQLNENGSYVFITQNDKANILPLKIKVWDVIHLKEHQECVTGFDKKLVDLKQQKLNRLDLIVDNTYLAVTYYDQEHEDQDNFSSFLERYQIISKEMLASEKDRDDVFTFDPLFKKKEDEEYFYPVARLKVHAEAEKSEFIFPMKIFLDSKNVNKNQNVNVNKSPGLSIKNEMEKINFKVLFVLNKLYAYTDQNGAPQQGYPWKFIDVSMLKLHDWTTEQIKEEKKEWLMKRLCEHAAKEFFTDFYEKMNVHRYHEQEVKDPIDKITFSKDLKKYIDGQEGKLYMLPTDWIEWKSEWEKNPIIFSDIQVNMNIDQVSWNNKERREFLVYNNKFSGMKNLLCPMNSIKYTSQSQGVIQSIKNQKIKSHIRCVYKGLGSDTTIYSFFHEEIDNNLKVFKIQDDYEKADLDCALVFQEPEEQKSQNFSKSATVTYSDQDKEKEKLKYQKKFDSYKLGVLTIKKFTQNIIYKICKPEERVQNMKQLHHRTSVGQVFNAQYPCMATNLGLTKMCIHINLNKLNPKALIYDWNNQENQEDQAEENQEDQAEENQDQEQNKDQDGPSVDLDQISNNGQDKNYEIFVGFVNYNQFSDLGLDERHICVDICARFAYLTRKPSEDDPYEGKEQMYLNILIVDAYNPIPQVVHFKSKKIFDFKTDDQFEDVIKENLIFKAGDEIHLMTQFPRAIHHAILTTDLTKEALDENMDMNSAAGMSHFMGSQIDEEELLHQIDEKFGDMSDNGSQNSQVRKLKEAAKQFKDKHLLKAQKESMEKIRKALFKKLTGQIIPVTLLQDNKPEVFSVYFAMKSVNFENFIEIMQFDPTQDQKNTVKVILTLRKKNLLVFEQMKDGSFFIVDEQGVIGIYNFNGSMLERTDFLYMHPEDQQKIKKFGEFTRVIIDRDVMIAPRHVFYLFESRDNIIPGVLMSENLVDTIQSDYNFDCVDGPIRYKGQDAFINMYCYKDSQDEQVFYFRQIIYRKPNTAKKSLVNDFNKACDMSTFLESEDILCNFGSKFLQFDRDGNPRDELIFQGHPTQFLGETDYSYSNQIYIVAYWHQFKCENDDGICQKIFILNPKDEEQFDEDDNGKLKFQEWIKNQPAQQSLKNRYQRNVEFKQANEFFQAKTKTEIVENDQVTKMVNQDELEGANDTSPTKKPEAESQVKVKNKLTPGVLVLVDKNRGLCYLDHQTKGSFWHQKCVKKAIKDYQQRMELVSISDNSKYFLFCDNFLQTFSVWRHADMSHQIVKKYLENSQVEKPQKINKVAKQKSEAISRMKNKPKILDYNKVSRPKERKEKNYPEHEYPPQDLPPKSKKRYIKKFLRIVSLAQGVKFTRNLETNSLANHQMFNLLNSNKTKFIAKDVHLHKGDEFCFILNFKKGQKISAFGLRSANNYPHLDPSHIRIEVKLDEQQHDTHKENGSSDTSDKWGMDSLRRSASNLFKTQEQANKQEPQFETCLEVEDVEYKFRSEMIYFIKPKPWEYVKEVRIYILKNKWTKVSEDIIIDRSLKSIRTAGHDLTKAQHGHSHGKSKHDEKQVTFLTFQLAQIEILEKKEFFDFQFKKQMDLVMWKQEVVVKNEMIGNELQGEDLMNIFHDLENGDSDEECNDVVTYDFKDKDFGSFDQCIQKKLAFLRQDNVTKQIIIERGEDKTGAIIDKTLKVVFGHCDHDLKAQSIKVLGTIFEMDLEEYNDQQLAYDSNKNIDPPFITIEPSKEKGNFRKLIPYSKSLKKEEQSSVQHYQKKIMKLKEENEKFVLQQLALESYQRELNTIYKNQEKIRKQIYKFRKLISVKFNKNIFVIKKSQSVQYGKMEDLWVDDKIQKRLPMTKLGYELPNASNESQTSIQNVYFTADFDQIQILAIDFIKNLLVMATWDIKNDYETNMLQIKNESEETDMAELVILKGLTNVKNKQGAQDKNKKKGKTEDKEKAQALNRKGAFNYILNKDTFIDLENNIPFMFSDVNNDYEDNDDIQLMKQSVANTKKIFKDSTRFLNPYEKHQLVYCNTQKDIQLWYDVGKQTNRKAAIRKTMSVIDAFRIQYQGMSLFHHFANDQQIVKLVHQEYMQAKEQELFENDSQRDMPLFILCPDDKKQMVAMELAIKHQKPTNFEYMVSMLKDFDHISSSKMMLGNFNEMMTLGFGQILEYFDKSTFNPPLLSTPFVINWPDSLQEFPFESSTSLITEKILKEEVEKKMKWSLDNLKFNISFRNNKPQDKKFQLKVENDGNKKAQRRIQVQALDFDWIFDGTNAESFLKLLDLKGTDQLFNQRSIQLFIELMWSKYQFEILMYPALGYLINLIILIFLTSLSTFSYMENLPICRDESDHDHSGNFNLSFGTRDLDNCTDKASFYKLNHLWQGNFVLCCLSFGAVIWHFQREVKQIAIIGSPIDYITSLWNVFDMSQAIFEATYLGLMFHILFRNNYSVGITLRHLKHIRTFGAWIIFMKWFKIFYWGKLFKTSAYFIVQLYETVAEMQGFLSLLIMCIIAFTNFFMVIQKNKDAQQQDEFGNDEHPNYVTSYVDSEFFAAFISVYLLSLGDFQELEGYSEGHDRQFAWIMFVFGTIIIQLIFMNMLIAVMSTPFSIVKENETLFRYKQQLSIILDYIDLVPINDIFKKQKYIMVVKPEEIKVDDGGNEKDMIIDQIRDTLKSDRKNNDRQFAKLNDLMEKQISSIKIDDDSIQDQTAEAKNKDQSADAKNKDQPTVAK